MPTDNISSFRVWRTRIGSTRTKRIALIGNRGTCCGAWTSCGTVCRWTSGAPCPSVPSLQFLVQIRSPDLRLRFVSIGRVSHWKRITFAGKECVLITIRCHFFLDEVDVTGYLSNQSDTDDHSSVQSLKSGSTDSGVVMSRLTICDNSEPKWVERSDDEGAGGGCDWGLLITVSLPLADQLFISKLASFVIQPQQQTNERWRRRKSRGDMRE